MVIWTEKLKELALMDIDIFSNFISTIAVLLAVWLVYIVTNRIVSKRTEDQSIRYSWRKITRYISVFVCLILIIRLWFHGFQSIVTILGIVAAAIVITHKETILNLTGSIFILWRDLFVVGDRIEIGKNIGDVTGLGMFYFTLMEINSQPGAQQSTGRIIKVPNSMIFVNPIINYTKHFPYIWNEQSVLLSIDSDGDLAKSTFLEIVEKHAISDEEEVQKVLKGIRDEVIIIKHFRPIVYMKLKQDSPTGILLTARYLCEPRRQRDVENEIWREILEALTKNEYINLVMG